jgi:Ala-tRNA(Pro) deacylase
MQQRAWLGKRGCAERSSPAKTALKIAESPAPVAATRQDLLARLAALGIETETVEHPAVFTVAESSVLERRLPGGHTKNLFLKDRKDQLLLIVALGHARIDLKTLHKSVGCERLSFGRPELLMEVLGVPAGSVTPFALINDKARRVTVILDADMMRHQRLNYHPLENTATTNIAREDLVAFIRACGHEPRIVAVTSTED